MKKKLLPVMAWILAIGMLFSGCEILGLFSEDSEEYGLQGQTLKYTRPDMAEHDRVLEEACRRAMKSDNFTEVSLWVGEYYDEYDSFFTNYALAEIHYCCDMTDSYWEAEYAYCYENAYLVEAGLETLYQALAQSPCRDELESEDNFGAGYFDSYEGEGFYDETMLDLMDRETQLLDTYYDLLAEASQVESYSQTYFEEYYPQLAQVYVDLVKQRQEIAAYVGYDSYSDFAYDFYYYRDYTPAQAESYLEEIGAEFSQLYWAVNDSDIWEWSWRYCTESQVLDYVKTAAENMGGDIATAFSVLEKDALYHIKYNENKYPGAFETYLYSYQVPYIYMSPNRDQTDKLTLVHEFGHFTNDLLCWQSYAGIDVAEVHSQAMEYLSLCYGENTEKLTQYKMVDSICIYVEEAAYALFEQRVYDLPAEEVTVERVQQIYEEIGNAFGFDSWGFDSRDYVSVDHFFTSPCYIISYVVSNDMAFQIYQLELEEKGAGLEVYRECLYSEESYIMSFAEEYGLESPFAEGRVQSVRKTLEELLKDAI